MTHRLLLSLCAVLFACLPLRLAAADLGAIHTIGVVSAIGHTVTLKASGFILDNSETPLAVDAWNLDGEVFTAISDALKDRYAVRQIDADKVAFSTAANSWWAYSEVPVEDLVAKLADRDGIDAWLVVYPFSAEDTIHDTNQWLRGCGVYRHPDLFKSGVDVYCYYRVALIDAHTNKIIDTGLGSVAAPSLFDRHWPVVHTDDSLWTATTGDLDDTQRQRLRGIVSQLLQTSVPWALSGVGLHPKPAG